MPLLRQRRCKACETEYEVLESKGQVIGMGDDDCPDCPQCGGSEYEGLIGAPLGIDLGDEASVGRHYPRWDSGLGCMVNSAKHRRQLCKERGLVPVDGDFDVEADVRKSEYYRDGVRKRNAALRDEMEHSPEFREMRELRDRGYFQEQARIQRGR